MDHDGVLLGLKHTLEGDRIPILERYRQPLKLEHGVHPAVSLTRPWLKKRYVLELWPLQNTTTYRNLGSPLLKVVPIG